jgi:hypothetical protein
MDVREMIAGLKDLDRGDLARLREALGRRLREFGDEVPGEGRRTPVSDVLEYRPHADGYLQFEVRRYVRKDGSMKEHGPYWYFRYHEDGRQRTLYLGKTNDPEGVLEHKRSGRGE